MSDKEDATDYFRSLALDRLKTIDGLEKKIRGLEVERYKLKNQRQIATDLLFDLQEFNYEDVNQESYSDIIIRLIKATED